MDKKTFLKDLEDNLFKQISNQKLCEKCGQQLIENKVKRRKRN